jgi:hypothetical protein
VVTESDRIRSDIERTRDDLAEGVSTLADRTSPKRIAERRWDDVRQRARSVRYRVMGTSGSANDAVSDKASGVAGTVRQAPDAVLRQTQGSPLAAGLVAFGAGLLSAALLPESNAEQRVGHKLAEQAEPLIEPVRSATRDMAGDVKDSAQAAASEIGDAAKQGAVRTAEQAKQSGQAARNQM